MIQDLNFYNCFKIFGFGVFPLSGMNPFGGHQYQHRAQMLDYTCKIRTIHSDISR